MALKIVCAYLWMLLLLKNIRFAARYANTTYELNAVIQVSLDSPGLKIVGLIRVVRRSSPPTSFPSVYHFVLVFRVFLFASNFLATKALAIVYVCTWTLILLEKIGSKPRYVSISYILNASTVLPYRFQLSVPVWNNFFKGKPLAIRNNIYPNISRV